MAERRMFAKSIIDSDAFLDMPLSTQALYFHLAMRADDDGFLNNANRIIRTIGANPNDMDMLLVKKFIIRFEEGICVIKHWRIHNYIQADRYHETNYKDKKSILNVDENKAYTFDDTGRKLIGNKIVYNTDSKCIQGVINENTKCLQGGYSKKLENKAEASKNRHLEESIKDVYITDTQVRLGKVSKVKDSSGKEREEDNSISILSFPSEIHKLIYEQFGDVSYKTWFIDSIIEIKDNILKIIVDSSLKKQIIQDKYSKNISALIGKSVFIEENIL